MVRFLLALALLLLGILAAVLVTPSFLLVVGGPVAILAFTVKKHRRYALDIWLGFDKFANACMGGDHRETVSSRLGKSIDHDCPSVFFVKPIDRLVYSCLNVVDPDHCTKSIDWTVGRKYQ